MLRGDNGLAPRLGLGVVRAKINSVLLYGCDILSPHPQADIVQRKALRKVVATYDRTHNWFIYSELGESRISTLAMVSFIAATGRLICSATPVARALGFLAVEVIDALENDNEESYIFLPWQRRLLLCLKALLCFDGCSVQQGKIRRLDLKQVIKLGVRDREGFETKYSDHAGEALSRKRLTVRELLQSYSADASIGLNMCNILRLICNKRISLADEKLTSSDGRLVALRVTSKSLKALAKTYGLLYEHTWWSSEATKAGFALGRIAGPGEGQAYLTMYSVRYAAMGFLFRSGSFNPPDVVEREGEKPCRLCGEPGGDTPLHLVALCSGGRGNEKAQMELERLRKFAGLLFGAAELTDLGVLVYGLVGKTRGVTTKTLTRERVEEGCEVLHDFYQLRRKAAQRNANNA
jgi:hypothetical protein